MKNKFLNLKMDFQKLCLLLFWWHMRGHNLLSNSLEQTRMCQFKEIQSAFIEISWIEKQCPVCRCSAQLRILNRYTSKHSLSMFVRTNLLFGYAQRGPDRTSLSGSTVVRSSRGIFKYTCIYTLPIHFLIIRVGMSVLLLIPSRRVRQPAQNNITCSSSVSS